MKVCFDFQSAIGQRSGVGRYAFELLRHLGETAEPGDELSAFYFDFKRNGVPLDFRQVTPHACTWLPGRVAYGLWKTFRFPPYTWFAGDADLYHFPAFIRPPMSIRRKSVITVHDVSFLRHPETTEPKNLKWLRNSIQDSVEKADAILTVSGFSADEIVDLLHVPRGKVFPIHLGMHPLGPAMLPPEQAAALRQEAGIQRPYLLMVGNLEPRKNIPFLIRVFDALKAFDGDLVLVGGAGWKNEPIFAAMENAVRRERIHWLSYVSDEQLQALYAGASLFVFPSIYEGFGLPPLEAAIRGIPVVCARNSSLPEVMGDAAEWVDGFDVAEWAGRIHALLANDARLDELRAKGRARGNIFTWREAAEKTRAVYRQVLNG